MRSLDLGGDESDLEAAFIALSFETGLEQFYGTLLERSGISEVRDLMEKLIRAEESHRWKLLCMLEPLDAGPAALPPTQIRHFARR